MEFRRVYRRTHSAARGQPSAAAVPSGSRGAGKARAASLSAVAFTTIMNRIVVSFVRSPVPPAPIGICRNVDRLGGESTPGDEPHETCFFRPMSILGLPVRRQSEMGLRAAERSDG